MSELNVSPPPPMYQRPQPTTLQGTIMEVLGEAEAERVPVEESKVDSEKEQVKKEVLELLKEYGLSPSDLTPATQEDLQEGRKEVRTRESESPEVDAPRGPKIALPLGGQLSEKDAKRIGVSDNVVRGLSGKESTLLLKLRAYCHDHAVALVLKSLCEQVPEAFPNYRTWEGPDIVPLIYARIQERGHIERLWPSIRMVLGDNRFNVSWCSRVLIGMTVWMVVWDVAPTLKCNERPANYPGVKR